MGDSLNQNIQSPSNAPKDDAAADFANGPSLPTTKKASRSTLSENSPKPHHKGATIAKWVKRILHLAVLFLSIYLIITISIDTFNGGGIEDYHRPGFLKTQVIICMVFLVDFFVELFMANEGKWRYFFTHFIFLVVSIPYLWIIHHIGFQYITPRAAYLIQYIPLVRGGYALALVVGWLTANKAANLLFTYLITLIATVYFASLAFFMFEQNVNSAVQTYSDALWWACMDMTTVGSSIQAMTPLGRILSVLLAALGMMMLPIFTVYITNIIQGHHSKKMAKSTPPSD